MTIRCVLTEFNEYIFVLRNDGIKIVVGEDPDIFFFCYFISEDKPLSGDETTEDEELGD